MKGDLERALECIEQAMGLSRELGDLRTLAFKYDSLIQILIEKGDLERARISLRDLEQLNNQLKDKPTNLMYLFDKALLLKTSSRALNRGKAEEILKQLLQNKDSSIEGKIRALVNLCELLLTELRISNDLEVLDELNQFISQLLELAEKSNSYWILCETYLIQAKVALMTFDMNEARRFLTQAQEIAEKYGLNLLAMKISNEHDEFLKQLDTWEKLKESNAPLAERMELSRLNEQIDNMLRKRVSEPEEIKEEVSVVILIMSVGGTPIFSQSFAEGWSFKDHLFGGFLSAINSFSGEMFSQGLDRAIFGEYTILMKAVSQFIVCYLFKGQSFLAQQRMKQFIDIIQNDKKIWESIKKYYQAHRLIQEEDVPSLDILVNDIFIERATEFN
jgi:tetratricopeptide (TPR) repeat protein